MRAGAAAIVGLLPLAACSSPTSVLLALRTADGLPAPASLRVRAYGAGALGDRRIDMTGRSLPGTLELDAIDAAQPDFRVIVDGLDAAGALVEQAAAHIPLVAGEQARAELVLDRPLADGDGDGVPDSVDDCPLAADPEQRCATPDLAVPPPDLARADFANADFAPPPPDLTAPPDLAPQPCPSFAVFCDDFETGDFSKWTRLGVQPGLTLTNDTVRPWRGARSMHAAAAVGGASAYGMAVKDLTQGTSTWSVRAYVYSTGAPGGYALFTQLFDNTIASGFSAGIDNANTWVITEYLNGPSVDHHSSTAFATGTWICVEMTGLRSATQLTLQLWVADQVVINATSSMLMSPDELDVGYTRAPPGTTNDLFVDDVALAHQHIGCE